MNQPHVLKDKVAVVADSRKEASVAAVVAEATTVAVVAEATTVAAVAEAITVVVVAVVTIVTNQHTSGKKWKSRCISGTFLFLANDELIRTDSRLYEMGQMGSRFFPR
jgi:hypothetical protein